MKKFAACFVLIFCLIGQTVFAETVVPILMYHNLNNSYLPEHANVEMRPDEFREQVTTLISAGYTPIRLYDYTDWVNGKKDLPEKPIIITFDDGYLNNYTHAFPVAKELNIPITIFIITDRMGMSDGVAYPHFTWEQAREMNESGVVDIESHTNAHSDLFLADNKTVINELWLSKYLIKKHLNRDANYLAFPYGNYSDFVKQQAEKAGYKACVKIKPLAPGLNRKGDDVYELKRLTACGGMTGQDIIDLIQRCGDK